MPQFELPPYRVEALFSASQLSETVDWGLVINGIPDLWRATEGEGVKVAVLDTGCQLDHPDLQSNLAGAQDFTRSRYGAGDAQGHGTHCCGVVAAIRNGAGVVGVAPKAKLLVGKVLGDNGMGDSRDIGKGIEWAVANGANVISMSLGGPEKDPWTAAAIKAANAAGVFIIAAAGNDGRSDSVNWPGRAVETIAVGAVDRNGRVTSFSSRGAQVDIAAPGQDVTSCYPTSRYAKLSGTSMATPFVAGVVALMLAKHRINGGQTPIKSADDLRAHLAKTAKDAGPQGHDPSYGFGLIQPGSMLEQLSPPIDGTQPLDVVLPIRGGIPVRIYMAER